MTLVIDANVAVALLIDLSYSERARETVSGAKSAMAPDLILYEVANTFWKLASAGQVDPEHLQTALAYVPNLFDQLVPPQTLAAEAFALSRELRHPAYDCFYIALTQATGGTLVSADRRLANLLQESSIGVAITYVGA